LVICGVANLPETLAQGELVGTVKGAFSGADSDKLGFLRSAEGGAICFEDVDGLPLAIQPYLLHFLDTHEVRPIGSTRTFKVNARIMATTNKDLQLLVAQGLFMRDLMYRLGEFVIRIPPLRERREDIAPLVQHLIQCLAVERHEAVRTVDPEAMVLLESAEWPGNCRQVSSAVLHCVLEAKGGVITPEIVRTVPGIAGPTEGTLSELVLLASLSENERRSKGIMVRALELLKGRVKETASALGITYRTFQRDCKRHGIRVRGG
jgi:DNA-binding NtrC family response regulator